MLHELTHVLDFYGAIRQDGSSDGQGGGIDRGGVYSKFDQFLGNQAGDRVIDPETFRINMALWDSISVGGTGSQGLYFHGPNAIAANGGQPISIKTGMETSRPEMQSS